MKWKVKHYISGTVVEQVLVAKYQENYRRKSKTLKMPKPLQMLCFRPVE